MNSVYKLLFVGSALFAGNLVCMENREPNRPMMTTEEADQNFRNIWLGTLGINNPHATHTDISRVYNNRRMSASTDEEAYQIGLAYYQLQTLLPAQPQAVNPNEAYHRASLTIPSATVLVPTIQATQQVTVQQPPRVQLLRRTYPDGRQTIIRRTIRAASNSTETATNLSRAPRPDTHPAFNPTERN